MFDTRTRPLFFACLKDAAGAGAALKNAAPVPGSDQQKWRLRLRNTGCNDSIGLTCHLQYITVCTLNTCIVYHCIPLRNIKRSPPPFSAHYSYVKEDQGNFYGYSREYLSDLEKLGTFLTGSEKRIGTLMHLIEIYLLLF